MAPTDGSQDVGTTRSFGVWPEASSSGAADDGGEVMWPRR